LFRSVACNNYEIVDLGLWSPKIIAAAIEHNVDIGIEGLNHASLDEMVFSKRTG
jgi:cobalamin-dependent methionine synthase I